MKFRPQTLSVIFVLGFALSMNFLAGCVSPQVQRQQLQNWVDSHPELSDSEKQNILGGKMYIGLPLEAAYLMNPQGMVKKDEMVTANGDLQVWNNGWFYLYFNNGKLVMWKSYDGGN